MQYSNQTRQLFDFRRRNSASTPFSANLPSLKLVPISRNLRGSALSDGISPPAQAAPRAPSRPSAMPDRESDARMLTRPGMATGMTRPRQPAMVAGFGVFHGLGMCPVWSRRFWGTSIVQCIDRHGTVTQWSRQARGRCACGLGRVMGGVVEGILGMGAGMRLCLAALTMRRISWCIADEDRYLPSYMCICV
jgi:hypothetical protein